MNIPKCILDVYTVHLYPKSKVTTSHILSIKHTNKQTHAYACTLTHIYANTHTLTFLHTQTELDLKLT